MPGPVTPTSASRSRFELVALLAPSGLDLGTTPPARLVVAPWGKSDLRERGVALVGAETLARFDASQKALRLDRVAIDFEHNTVPGTAAYEASAEPRKVAGYATAQAVDGVGLVLSAIDWTPEGLEALQGGHYQDVSPTIYRDEAGHVVGLHSVALVRHGEIQGLTLEAAATALSAQLLALEAAHSTQPPTPNEPPASTGRDLPTVTMKNLLKEILAALGITLADDADDAAYEAAAKEGAKKLDALMAKAEPAPAGADGEAEPMSALERRLQALEAKEEASERQAIVARATHAGKVIPLSAEDIAKTPVEVLSAMVEKLPAGKVPTAARTPEGAQPTQEPDALSAETRKFQRQLGVTDEELKAVEAETAA